MTRITVLTHHAYNFTVHCGISIHIVQGIIFPHNTVLVCPHQHIPTEKLRFYKNDSKLSNGLNLQTNICKDKMIIHDLMFLEMSEVEESSPKAIPVT